MRGTGVPGGVGPGDGVGNGAALALGGGLVSGPGAVTWSGAAAETLVASDATAIAVKGSKTPHCNDRLRRARIAPLCEVANDRCDLTCVV
jgi:hypothetical protein